MLYTIDEAFMSRVLQHPSIVFIILHTCYSAKYRYEKKRSNKEKQRLEIYPDLVYTFIHDKDGALCEMSIAHAAAQ